MNDIGRFRLDIRREICLFSFHPEMVFLADLGVNLHVCLCGGHQVVSTQMFDFLDIGQTGTHRKAVALRTRSV